MIRSPAHRGWIPWIPTTGATATAFGSWGLAVFYNYFMDCFRFWTSVEVAVPPSFFCCPPSLDLPKVPCDCSPDVQSYIRMEAEAFHAMAPNDGDESDGVEVLETSVEEFRYAYNYNKGFSYRVLNGN